MNPIIYACCLMEECIDHYEEGWRLEWSTDPPQLGEVISMGGHDRWCIVKIIIYRPQTAQAVDSVYLAYLHPDKLPVPPEDEWDNDLLRFDFDSKQSLYLEMVAIGKEELAVYAQEVCLHLGLVNRLKVISIRWTKISSSMIHPSFGPCSKLCLTCQF
jgi:hypothetical protein